MIDPTKSVVIFSHPRSGSTFFQKSLPHYYLGEMFLKKIQINGFDDRGMLNNYVKGEPTFDSYENELERRFKLYSHYTGIKPVSIKVHLIMKNDQIINFLKKQEDTQFVLVKRENKLDTFWSNLISWHTLDWHGPVKQTNLTINRVIFNMVIDMMRSYRTECDNIKSMFDVKEFVFENFIKYPKSDWFNPAPTFIQNAKEATTITNIDEVNQWIEEAKITEIVY